MPNFSEFFEDQYQFSLNDISYTKIESGEDLPEYELKISDTTDTEIIGDTLKITFIRNVYFEPSAMFNLRVAFDVILSFINDEAKEKAKCVNWSKMLTENPNLYLGNVASRVSYLVATITSSFGQQPLITPPNPILEDDV